MTPRIVGHQNATSVTHGAIIPYTPPDINSNAQPTALSGKTGIELLAQQDGVDRGELDREGVAEQAKVDPGVPSGRSGQRQKEKSRAYPILGCIGGQPSIDSLKWGLKCSIYPLEQVIILYP